MIKWLVRIEADTPAQVLDVFLHHQRMSSGSGARLVVDEKGDHLRIGIGGHAGLLSLSLAREIFAWAEAASKDVEFRFICMSSQVGTASTDLATLMSRWDETGEPPVLSIVALELGERCHVTRGLALFAGHELAVRFIDSEQSRDAARSLVRMAREALITGPISRDRDYEGIDGRTLKLDSSGNAAPSTMVTIVF